MRRNCSYNKFLLILLLSIIVSSNLLKGQPTILQKKENLPDATSFKSWLSQSWLKNEITYDTLEIVKGTLYLTLKLECENNCSAKWFAIKSSFDSISILSIETYLWNKAIFHLGDTRPLILEVYNTPKPYEQPCFLRSIYYKDSMVVKSADCKDLGATSYLPYEKFNPSYLMKTLDLSGIDKKSDQILDMLFKQSEKFYKSKGKDVKVIKSFTESHKITFNVTNLQNEVLTGPKSIEQLQVTIVCEFHTGKAKFEVIMNGKKASYLFKPVSQKGFIDMEEDNKSELQQYVNEFANNKINKWLK